MTATAWARRRCPRAPAYYLGRAAGWGLTALAPVGAGTLAKPSAPRRLPPSTSRSDMTPGGKVRR